MNCPTPTGRRGWMLRALRAAVGLCALLLVVLAATDALACPTCKDGLAGGDPLSQARATGYFYSILFMMAMPFVIVGTFGSAAYFSIRRAREQQSTGASVQGEPQAAEG